jgi:hypothetical protein
MKLKPLSKRKEEEGIPPTSPTHAKSKKVRAGRNKKLAAEPEKQSTREGRK